MSAADRRRQIEDVCHAALERDPAARAAFLATACDGDEALRREVEALLAHAQTAASFLETPLAAVAAQALTGASLVGRALGAYQIRARLGAGGMGEVYRAHDSKLRREVAIKILPADFTSDPERLRRFEHEARVLAALNHPHIAAIHGLEDSDGVRALILELVEGETLAERIARGPLPLREALTIARQIAEAIEAAHEKGIIHRDLTPANIKVTPAGTVKVLDFGLAKASTRSPSSQEQSVDTQPIASSEHGLVIGTAPYMSPEQARGEEVDQRTDLWAFGCLLYEMLSGRAAFARPTIAATFGAIWSGDVDWSRLPDAVPAELVQLLRKTLETERKLRYSASSDILADLKRVRRELLPARPPGRAGEMAPAGAVQTESGGLASGPRPRGLRAKGSWLSKAFLGAVAVLSIGAGFYSWQSTVAARLEIDSLVSYFEARAQEIEREMDQTVAQWKEVGLSDPSQIDWQASIAKLESKRARFRELHQRHTEALRAGRLTLAQLYARLANQTLNPDVAYSLDFNPPSVHDFTPSREYRELAAQRLDAEELTNLIADRSIPTDLRAIGLRVIGERCDSSPQCLRAFAAIYEVDDLSRFRGAADEKLCALGNAGRSVAPAIIKALARTPPNASEDFDLLKTLECIGFHEPELTPYLVRLLQVPAPDEAAQAQRRWAMQSLGRIGPAAREGIPALRIIAETGDQYSREGALYALQQIEK